MKSQHPAVPTPESKSKPQVYVYGGGVAGLTAAHELVIRGFDVQLYEREHSLGRNGAVEKLSLGGMARTQYFVIKDDQQLYYHSRRKPLDGSGPIGDSDQGPHAGRYFPECWLEFIEHGERISRLEMSHQSKKVLQEFIKKVKALKASSFLGSQKPPPKWIQIHIQVFLDSSRQAFKSPRGRELTPRDWFDARVKHMGDKTEEKLKQLASEIDADIVRSDDKKRDILLEAVSSLGDAPVARNWVRVLVFRTQLPGEHGYRFFPSYYRHVFDTMARTPLHDAQGRPSRGSVLDNLVPLPTIGLTNTTSAPLLFDWNALQAGSMLFRAEYNRRGLYSLHITPQDLLQFSLRVMRYMVSCPRRRAAELEDLSWWEYLEGKRPGTDTRLYHYSKAFTELVQSSSRVLAALDGKWGDAHTCGNTYVQLLIESLVPTSRNNCTLNAPTSEAWFFHWREHLEDLGVKFHRGELTALEEKDSQLIAKVQVPGKPRPRLKNIPTEEEIHGKGLQQVYFVVATDLFSAARASRTLKGVPEQLQSYAFCVPPRPGMLGDCARIRLHPEEDLDREPWDRLQTISGIQFFFEKQVSVVDGYLYCADSEWGLSAICSQIAWEDRPIIPLSRYQSVLSVDIGNWDAPSKSNGRRARDCTPEQLRDEVLRQLRASLHVHGSEGRQVRFVLPTPDWVHIDERMVYDPAARLGPWRNESPYLVPIVGDWKRRPGPSPWDPTIYPIQSPMVLEPDHWPYKNRVWQAAHGGYPVHYERLVFAGTWTKTFTRMTTMESANESARHAVNAVLDHYVQTTPEPKPPEQPPGVPPSPPNFYPSTSQGDYCRIWNPEFNELPDFTMLQLEDNKLFQDGLPHVFDLLGVEVLPSLLSQSPLLGSSYDQMMQWVGSLGTTLPGASPALRVMLRHLSTVLGSARPPTR